MRNNIKILLGIIIILVIMLSNYSYADVIAFPAKPTIPLKEDNEAFQVDKDDSESILIEQNYINSEESSDTIENVVNTNALMKVGRDNAIKKTLIILGVIILLVVIIAIVLYQIKNKKEKKK